MKQQTYVGIDQDTNSGLTHLGRIVRDAWLFGILNESETCASWNFARMQNLYEQVFAAWKPYDHLPSRLPEELRERHAKLYAQAITTARDKGWDAELNEEE